MFALRHRLRRLTWIALTAMLALALLPTLSHALAFARGDGALAEICTPQGAKLVAPGGETPAPDGTLLGHLDHCPLCSLHGAALGLPPVAVRHVEPSSLAHAVPPLFLAAPRRLFAWSAARPRGPPSFS